MPIYVATPARGVVDLAQLDVSSLFIGVMVGAVGTGNIYKLIESTDAADHDNLETVKDNANLRWQKQRVSTLTSTTKLLPGPDGNVQVNVDGAMADDAVTGFFTVPLLAATFEAGTALIDEGHAAVVVQETATAARLGVFLPGTGWLWTDELAEDA